MNCKEKLLEVRDIHKVYTKEGVPTKALNGITFDVLEANFGDHGRKRIRKNDPAKLHCYGY